MASVFFFLWAERFFLQRVCCRLVLLSLSVCLSSCLDCLFERAERDFQMFFFWAGAQTSMFSVRRVSVRALSVLVFSALRFDRRGWGKGGSSNAPGATYSHIAHVPYWSHLGEARRISSWSHLGEARRILSWSHLGVVVVVGACRVVFSFVASIIALEPGSVKERFDLV